MSKLDSYSQAVLMWQSSNRNLWGFAHYCALVDGTRTAALASECRLSVDSVENYRNSYRLFREMVSQLEDSEIVRIQAKSNISLWIAASKRRKELKLSRLFDLLKDAADNGATVEAFRVQLDNETSACPDWVRRLRSVIRGFGKLVDDYKTELPLPARERLEALAEYVAKELTEISEMEAV